MFLMKNFFLLANIAMITEKMSFYSHDNQSFTSCSLSIKLSLKKWSQTDKVYSRKVINGVPCSPLLSSQTLVTG